MLHVLAQFELPDNWGAFTATGLIGGAVGAIGSGLAVYFWARDKFRAAHEAESRSDLSIRMQEIDVAEKEIKTVRETSQWQSDLFKRRYEDLEKQMTDLRADNEKKMVVLHDAMHLLHRDHNECLKRGAILEARVAILDGELQRITKMVSPSTTIVVKGPDDEISITGDRS